MKKLIILSLLLLTLTRSLLADATKTVGSGGDYPTLKDAFDVINAGTIWGVITLQIKSDITEYSTAELFRSGYGSSSYTSITIYPTGSYTIDGDFDGPLINLNGADNVTIDGRINASGSTKSLTITNVNSNFDLGLPDYTSTICFINDATYNTIKYCIIKGSEKYTSRGLIFFSTATGSGNDSNTIDNNDITLDAAGRPINAIYSLGTSGSENTDNTISNNNIFNVFNSGSASNGVNIDAYSSAWTISGNSFYETSSLAPSTTGAYYAIKINNTSGIAFTITDNFIGGSTNSCGGTWTKTSSNNNVFYAIYLNVGTSTASSIQNNIIKSFVWSNSGAASWYGIYIAGGVINVGTINGNVIGDPAGTGSITITGGANNTIIYGINIASTGTVDCQNNTIGSITVANSNNSNSTNFYAINKTGIPGSTTISNNTIGSLTTASSINASSLSSVSAQSIYGISNAGTGTITIAGNKIANLTNGTTNVTGGIAGLINGIKSTNGTNTISDNIIRDLTISNANTSTDNSASLCGIAISAITVNVISGNTIYNLRNTYSTFAGNVTGLYFTGNTGTNSVKGNFIHSLSVTGASSNSASIYGIKIAAGATTYSNNIVSLGGTSQTTIYGIYETGAAGNNNNLFYNTVYIGGDGNGGSNNSYAFFSAVNTNSRDIRNNIFVNARTTAAGSNLHYAAYFFSTGVTLTCNYNDYYVSGTGGTLGYYGANKTALPVVSEAGQDVNSTISDPVFATAPTPPGTVVANYLPSAGSLIADAGTGISIDYNGAGRTIPTMGALEMGCANPTSAGSISADKSGCSPFDPAAFTSLSDPTGHTGTLEYKWMQSITGSGSGFSEIPGSNASSYNPGSITQTTWYKRVTRVSCKTDWTGALESGVSAATVTVGPIAGAISGGTSVCKSSTITLSPNASGTGTLSYTWASTVPGTATVNNSGVVNGVSAGSSGITYTVTDASTCSTTSPTLNFAVNALPSTGLTVGGGGVICSGSGTNISVALSETGFNYQLRNDNANELIGSPVAGLTGTTIYLPTGAIITNTTFNVLAINPTTSCSAKLTQTALLTIDPPSSGGSITGTSTITYGSSTGTMTLGTHTGTILRWEKRFNSGSWTTISNTGTTYSETPTSAGTYGYRVVVKSASCPEANSAEFSITVNQKALTITAENKSKDYGASMPALTFTYTGLVNGDTAPSTLPSISTTATASSPAGTYPITVSGAADPNYSISYVAGTLTINKVPLTITAVDKSKNYGAALPGLTLTYSGLVNGDTAPTTLPTISTTATAASPVNTYPITASAAADQSYNISYVAGTLTVNKVALTIAADAKSKVYGASLPTLTATYTGLVNGDTGPSTLPAINTVATAASPAGTYSITASAAADPNYNISYVAGIMTVNKAALTITADNKSKNYGALMPALTYTYSGLVNGDTAPVTLPAITTTATAASPAGTFPITVSGAGDPNYNISYVAGSLTVNKVALTITAVDKSKNYGAALPVLTVTYSGLVNGDAAPSTLPIISTTATAASPFGTYPITATGAADQSYNISYVAGALTVNKVALTITADAKSKNYGASLPVLTVTYTGLVNGDVAPTSLPTISTTATAASPVGTYPITAISAADPNYNISYIAGTLTVNKVSLTITADNKSKDYGSLMPVLTYTYSGLVNGDPAPATLPSITTTATGPSPAGTYPITVSGAVDPNYNISYVAGTLTVNKVALTITAADKSKDYGVSLPTLTYSYTGLVNGDTAPAILPSITTSATAASPGGTYPITLSGAADPNYNIGYVAGTLTINKVPLTITAVDKSKNYGAALPVLTVTYSGLVNGDTAPTTLPTISTTATASSPVNTYPITASAAADQSYNISYVAGTLTVNKVALTITADAKSKVYGASLPLLTATYTGLVNGDTAPSTLPAINTVATVASPAGTYAITASAAADPNYNISYIAGIMTVNKAALTITADNKSKNYGASVPALTYTYSGLVNGNTAPATLPAISSTATAASPAGTYPITVSGAADPNYIISYVAGSLTVNKVALIITAADKSKEYGASLPVLTYTYSGLVNGDTAPSTLPAISTSATAASPVGTYPITVSGGSDNNYTFSYVAGILTITKASQTISFTLVASKKYGDTDFTPTASASSSLTVDFSSNNLSVATIVAGKIHIAGAGTAIITASQPGDGNYNPASPVVQTLTVNKASLTFTADNKSKIYLAPLPSLTYTISGLVNGDPQNVLDILPAIQTTAVQNSPIGVYTITLTGGSDNNYSYLYVAGTLTITKIPQTITFTEYPEKLLAEDSYTLVATSTSGLTVLFESMNTALATVSGNILTGVSKGNVNIRAYNTGDQNYNSAEAIVTVEIYSTHKDIMHLFTPNGDGINDQWELPELSTWGKSDVRVFNRWGKLVFSNPDYNNLWDGTSNGSPLPEGPYYYVIKTENAGVVKGTLNIVR